MIIFFSPYPKDTCSANGGLLQRVMSVDSLFFNEERAYMECSFTKNIKMEKTKIDNKVTLFKVNIFVHFYFLLKAVLGANTIYAHTIANMFKPLLITFFIKNRPRLICDFHGVLPEESDMNAWKAKKLYYTFVEKLCVKNIDVGVCVTDAMASHFRNKYPFLEKQRFQIIVLPIFSRYKFNEKRVSEIPTKHGLECNKKIIYAGGAQIWQNIDLMLKSAISNPSLNFEFWLPKNEMDILEKKYNKYINIKFCTGSSSDVMNAYENFSQGFALRSDNIVNNVACPTKIVEYIHNGIVPIFLSQDVGDFVSLGLKYIKLEELGLISEKELKDAVTENFIVYHRFSKKIELGKRELMMKALK